MEGCRMQWGMLLNHSTMVQCVSLFVEPGCMYQTPRCDSTTAIWKFLLMLLWESRCDYLLHLAPRQYTGAYSISTATIQLRSVSLCCPHIQVKAGHVLHEVWLQ